jgi:hypothetical protein
VQPATRLFDGRADGLDAAIAAMGVGVLAAIGEASGPIGDRAETAAVQARERDLRSEAERS